MKSIKLSGKKFNRWMVIKRAENTTQGQSRWLCKCDCGTKKILKSIIIRRGISKSCGCYKIEEHTKRNIKHGHAFSNKISPTYHSWSGMIARSTNPKHKHFKYYGGKGIKVNKDWFNFKNFLADMGEKPKNTSLDRINNQGNYCRENCRWATRKEQARNKSNTAFYTINGITKSISEWAEIEGICRSSMVDRIKHNYYLRKL